MQRAQHPKVRAKPFFSSLVALTHNIKYISFFFLGIFVVCVFGVRPVDLLGTIF